MTYLKVLSTGHAKSAKLYREANERVHHDNLKNFLERLADRRERFMTQLSAFESNDSDKIENEKPTEQSISRRIATIPDSFSYESDAHALRTCLKSEQVTLAAFDETLRRANFSEVLTGIVLDQRNQIYSAVRTLAKLEPAVKHADG